jgi:4-nitrophenyl phosphatase
MDGTLALGDQSSGGHAALPGAVEVLSALRRCGIPYRVLTNGTAKSPRYYAASLRNAGLDLADDEMMTPSSSAALYFSRKGTKRVRVLGGEGAMTPLREVGIDVIGPAERAESIEAVYTGWFREFTFPHLEAACRDIWAGAALATASHVRFFATREGRGIGSSFAINTMLKAMTDCKATVLGKPSRHAFYTVLEHMRLPRISAKDVVVVGDDPALEMRMANSVGAVSVCVATGLQALEGMSSLDERERPLLGLSGVDRLLELLP